MGEGRTEGKGAQETLGWKHSWLCILIMMMVSQVYTFAKTHQTVYFKWVHFTLSKFYLNKLLIFLKDKNLFYHV